MERRLAGNIFLIGFSGTGKSAVGRELARRLRRGFVDTDEQIVDRFGKSIDRIFAEDGERRFRAVERELVAQACARQGLVVSVGGGAVVDASNRALIADGNVVVLLEASPEVILERLRSDTAEVRPLLAVDDPLGRIRDLKAARADAYSVAHVTVVTDHLTPGEAADEILRWLTSRGGGEAG